MSNSSDTSTMSDDSSKEMMSGTFIQIFSSPLSPLCDDLLLDSVLTTKSITSTAAANVAGTTTNSSNSTSSSVNYPVAVTATGTVNGDNVNNNNINELDVRRRRNNESNNMITSTLSTLLDDDAIGNKQLQNVLSNDNPSSSTSSTNNNDNNNNVNALISENNKMMQHTLVDSYPELKPEALPNWYSTNKKEGDLSLRERRLIVIRNFHNAILLNQSERRKQKTLMLSASSASLSSLKDDNIINNQDVETEIYWLAKKVIFGDDNKNSNMYDANDKGGNDNDNIVRDIISKAKEEGRLINLQEELLAQLNETATITSSLSTKAGPSSSENKQEKEEEEEGSMFPSHRGQLVLISIRMQLSLMKQFIKKSSQEVSDGFNVLEYLVIDILSMLESLPLGYFSGLEKWQDSSFSMITDTFFDILSYLSNSYHGQSENGIKNKVTNLLVSLQVSFGIHRGSLQEILLSIQQMLSQSSNDEPMKLLTKADSITRRFSEVSTFSSFDSVILSKSLGESNPDSLVCIRWANADTISQKPPPILPMSAAKGGLSSVSTTTPATTAAFQTGASPIDQKTINLSSLDDKRTSSLWSEIYFKKQQIKKLAVGNLVMLAPGEEGNDVLRAGEIGRIISVDDSLVPYQVCGPNGTHSHWFGASQVVEVIDYSMSTHHHTNAPRASNVSDFGTENNNNNNGNHQQPVQPAFRIGGGSSSSSSSLFIDKSSTAPAPLVRQSSRRTSALQYAKPVFRTRKYFMNQPAVLYKLALHDSQYSTSSICSSHEGSYIYVASRNVGGVVRIGSGLNETILGHVYANYRISSEEEFHVWITFISGHLYVATRSPGSAKVKFNELDPMTLNIVKSDVKTIPFRNPSIYNEERLRVLSGAFGTSMFDSIYRKLNEFDSSLPYINGVGLIAKPSISASLALPGSNPSGPDNATVVWSGHSDNESIGGSFWISEGKWYYEMQLLDASVLRMGWATTKFTGFHRYDMDNVSLSVSQTDPLRNGNAFWGLDVLTGEKINGNGSHEPFCTPCTYGDIIRCYIDISPSQPLSLSSSLLNDSDVKQDQNIVTISFSFNGGKPAVAFKGEISKFDIGGKSDATLFLPVFGFVNASQMKSSLAVAVNFGDRNNNTTTINKSPSDLEAEYLFVSQSLYVSPSKSISKLESNQRISRFATAVTETAILPPLCSDGRYVYSIYTANSMLPIRKSASSLSGFETSLQEIIVDVFDPLNEFRLNKQLRFKMDTLSPGAKDFFKDTLASNIKAFTNGNEIILLRDLQNVSSTGTKGERKAYRLRIADQSKELWKTDSWPSGDKLIESNRDRTSWISEILVTSTPINIVTLQTFGVGISTHFDADRNGIWMYHPVENICMFFQNTGYRPSTSTKQIIKETSSLSSFNAQSKPSEDIYITCDPITTSEMLLQQLCNLARCVTPTRNLQTLSSPLQSTKQDIYLHSDNPKVYSLFRSIIESGLKHNRFNVVNKCMELLLVNVAHISSQLQSNPRLLTKLDVTLKQELSNIRDFLFNHVICVDHGKNINIEWNDIIEKASDILLNGRLLFWEDVVSAKTFASDELKSVYDSAKSNAPISASRCLFLSSFIQHHLSPMLLSENTSNSTFVEQILELHSFFTETTMLRIVQGKSSAIKKNDHFSALSSSTAMCILAQIGSDLSSITTLLTSSQNGLNNNSINSNRDLGLSMDDHIFLNQSMDLITKIFRVASSLIDEFSLVAKRSEKIKLDEANLNRFEQIGSHSTKQNKSATTGASGIGLGNGIGAKKYLSKEHATKLEDVLKCSIVGRVLPVAAVWLSGLIRIPASGPTIVRSMISCDPGISSVICLISSVLEFGIVLSGQKHTLMHFSWSRMKSVSQTFESAHPYSDNMKERWVIKIPRARFMHVRFHQSSKTEERRDFIRFLRLRADGSHFTGGYSDSAPTQDRYGEERYSGSGGWPGTKDSNGKEIAELIIPSDTVVCTFETDDSTVDWGYKFTVSADVLSSEQVVVHSWYSHMLDISRELITSIVHASLGPSVNPLTAQESCYLRWVQNPIFVSGLQKISRQRTVNDELLNGSLTISVANPTNATAAATTTSEVKTIETTHKLGSHQRRKERRLSITYAHQRKIINDKISINSLHQRKASAPFLTQEEQDDAQLAILAIEEQRETKELLLQLTRESLQPGSISLYLIQALRLPSHRVRLDQGMMTHRAAMSLFSGLIHIHRLEKMALDYARMAMVHFTGLNTAEGNASNINNTNNNSLPPPPTKLVKAWTAAQGARNWCDNLVISGNTKKHLEDCGELKLYDIVEQRIREKKELDMSFDDDRETVDYAALGELLAKRCLFLIEKIEPPPAGSSLTSTIIAGVNASDMVRARWHRLRWYYCPKTSEKLSQPTMDMRTRWGLLISPLLVMIRLAKQFNRRRGSLIDISISAGMTSRVASFRTLPTNQKQVADQQSRKSMKLRSLSMSTMNINAGQTLGLQSSPLASAIATAATAMQNSNASASGASDKRIPPIPPSPTTTTGGMMRNMHKVRSLGQAAMQPLLQSPTRPQSLYHISESPINSRQGKRGSITSLGSLDEDDIKDITSIAGTDLSNPSSPSIQLINSANNNNVAVPSSLDIDMQKGNKINLGSPKTSDGTQGEYEQDNDDSVDDEKESSITNQTNGEEVKRSISFRMRRDRASGGLRRASMQSMVSRSQMSTTSTDYGSTIDRGSGYVEIDQIALDREKSLTESVFTFAYSAENIDDDLLQRAFKDRNERAELRAAGLSIVNAIVTITRGMHGKPEGRVIFESVIDAAMRSLRGAQILPGYPSLESAFYSLSQSLSDKVISPSKMKSAAIVQEEETESHYLTDLSGSSSHLRLKVTGKLFILIRSITSLLKQSASNARYLVANKKPSANQTSSPTTLQATLGTNLSARASFSQYNWAMVRRIARNVQLLLRACAFDFVEEDYSMLERSHMLDALGMFLLTDMDLIPKNHYLSGGNESKNAEMDLESIWNVCWSVFELLIKRCIVESNVGQTSSKSKSSASSFAVYSGHELQQKLLDIVLLLLSKALDTPSFSMFNARNPFITYQRKGQISSNWNKIKAIDDGNDNEIDEENLPESIKIQNGPFYLSSNNSWVASSVNLEANHTIFFPLFLCQSGNVANGKDNHIDRSSYATFTPGRLFSIGNPSLIPRQLSTTKRQSAPYWTCLEVGIDANRRIIIEFSDGYGDRITIVSGCKDIFPGKWYNIAISVHECSSVELRIAEAKEDDNEEDGDDENDEFLTYSVEYFEKCLDSLAIPDNYIMKHHSSSIHGGALSTPMLTDKRYNDGDDDDDIENGDDENEEIVDIEDENGDEILEDDDEGDDDDDDGNENEIREGRTRSNTGKLMIETTNKSSRTKNKSISLQFRQALRERLSASIRQANNNAQRHPRLYQGRQRAGTGKLEIPLEPQAKLSLVQDTEKIPISIESTFVTGVTENNINDKAMIENEQQQNQNKIIDDIKTEEDIEKDLDMVDEWPSVTLYSAPVFIGKYHHGANPYKRANNNGKNSSNNNNNQDANVSKSTRYQEPIVASGVIVESISIFPYSDLSRNEFSQVSYVSPLRKSKKYRIPASKKPNFKGSGGGISGRFARSDAGVKFSSNRSYLLEYVSRDNNNKNEMGKMIQQNQLSEILRILSIAKTISSTGVGRGRVISPRPMQLLLRTVLSSQITIEVRLSAANVLKDFLLGLSPDEASKILFDKVLIQNKDLDEDIEDEEGEDDDNVDAIDEEDEVIVEMNEEEEEKVADTVSKKYSDRQSSSKRSIIDCFSQVIGKALFIWPSCTEASQNQRKGFDGESEQKALTREAKQDTSESISIATELIRIIHLLCRNKNWAISVADWVSNKLIELNQGVVSGSNLPEEIKDGDPVVQLLQNAVASLAILGGNYESPRIGHRALLFKMNELENGGMDSKLMISNKETKGMPLNSSSVCEVLILASGSLNLGSSIQSFPSSGKSTMSSSSLSDDNQKNEEPRDRDKMAYTSLLAIPVPRGYSDITKDMKVTVSSDANSRGGARNVLMNTTSSYWESNGRAPHWIQLEVPKGRTMKMIYIYTKEDFDSYSPKKVAIKLGSNPLKMRTVKEIELENRTKWVQLLKQEEIQPTDTTFFFEIQKNYDNGIDSRVQAFCVFGNEHKSSESGIALFTDDNSFTSSINCASGMKTFWVRSIMDISNSDGSDVSSSINNNNNININNTNSSGSATTSSSGGDTATATTAPTGVDFGGVIKVPASMLIPVPHTIPNELLVEISNIAPNMVILLQNVLEVLWSFTNKKGKNKDKDEMNDDSTDSIEVDINDSAIISKPMNSMIILDMRIRIVKVIESLVQIPSFLQTTGESSLRLFLEIAKRENERKSSPTENEFSVSNCLVSKVKRNDKGNKITSRVELINDENEIVFHPIKETIDEDEHHVIVKLKTLSMTSGIHSWDIEYTEDLMHDESLMFGITSNIDMDDINQQPIPRSFASSSGAAANVSEVDTSSKSSATAKQAQDIPDSKDSDDESHNLFTPSSSLWLIRSFDGYCFHKYQSGNDGEESFSSPIPFKIHPGDVIHVELNMDIGILMISINQGPYFMVFANIKNEAPNGLWPCFAAYNTESILKIKIKNVKSTIQSLSRMHNMSMLGTDVDIEDRVNQLMEILAQGVDVNSSERNIKRQRQNDILDSSFTSSIDEDIKPESCNTFTLGSELFVAGEGNKSENDLSTSRVSSLSSNRIIEIDRKNAFLHSIMKIRAILNAMLTPSSLTLSLSSSSSSNNKTSYSLVDVISSAPWLIDVKPSSSENAQDATVNGISQDYMVSQALDGISHINFFRYPTNEILGSLEYWQQRNHALALISSSLYTTDWEWVVDTLIHLLHELSYRLAKRTFGVIINQWAMQSLSESSQKSKTSPVLSIMNNSLPKLSAVLDALFVSRSLKSISQNSQTKSNIEDTTDELDFNSSEVSRSRMLGNLFNQPSSDDEDREKSKDELKIRCLSLMTSSLVSIGKILSAQKSLTSQHLLHYSQDINPLIATSDEGNENEKDEDSDREDENNDENSKSNSTSTLASTSTSASAPDTTKSEKNSDVKEQNTKKPTLIQNKSINATINGKNERNDNDVKSRKAAKKAIKSLLLDETGENEAQKLLTKLVGRVVEARESASGPFSSGLIRCLNPNGTVVVDFIGTSTSRDDVPVDHLRFPQPLAESLVSDKNDYVIGSAVEVQFLGRARWYPADIVAVNDDGTYDVHYADNDKEQRINPRFIRHWMTTKYISFPQGSLVYASLNTNPISRSDDNMVNAKVILQHDDGSYTVRIEQEGYGLLLPTNPTGDHRVGRHQVKSRRSDSGRGGLTAAAIGTAAQYSTLRSLTLEFAKSSHSSSILSSSSATSGALAAKKSSKGSIIDKSKGLITLCDRYGPRVPEEEDDSDSAKLSIMNYPVPEDCVIKTIVFRLHHTPEGDVSQFQLMVFNKLPGSECSVENGGTSEQEEGKHEFTFVSKHPLSFDKNSKAKQVLQVDGKVFVKKGQYIGLFNPSGELRLNYSMKNDWAPPTDSASRSVEVCFMLKSTSGVGDIETSTFKTREWHGTTGWYAELQPTTSSSSLSHHSSIKSRLSTLVAKASDQLQYDENDYTNDDVRHSNALCQYISAGTAILRCKRNEVYFDECSSATSTICQACWMISQMIEEEVVPSLEVAKFNGLIPAITQICKDGLFLIPDRANRTVSSISGALPLHDSIRPPLESTWLPVLDLIQQLSNALLANELQIIEYSEHNNNGIDRIDENDEEDDDIDDKNKEKAIKEYFSCVQSFAPLYLAMKKKADQMHATRIERKDEIHSLSMEFAKKDSSSSSKDAFLSSPDYRLMVLQYQKEDAWFHRLLRCLESLQKLMHVGEKLALLTIARSNKSKLSIDNHDDNEHSIKEVQNENDMTISSLSLQVSSLIEDIEKNGDKVSNEKMKESNEDNILNDGASFIEIELYPMKKENDLSSLLQFCVDDAFVVRTSKLPLPSELVDDTPNTEGAQEEQQNNSNNNNENDESVSKKNDTKPVRRSDNVELILESGIMSGDILLEINDVDISSMLKYDYTQGLLLLHHASYGPIHDEKVSNESKPIRLKFGRYPLQPNFNLERAIQLAKINKSSSASSAASKDNTQNLQGTSNWFDDFIKASKLLKSLSASSYSSAAVEAQRRSLPKEVLCDEFIHWNQRTETVKVKSKEPIKVSSTPHNPLPLSTQQSPTKSIPSLFAAPTLNQHVMPDFIVGKSMCVSNVQTITIPGANALLIEFDPKIQLLKSDNCAIVVKEGSLDDPHGRYFVGAHCSPPPINVIFGSSVTIFVDRALYSDTPPPILQEDKTLDASNQHERDNTNNNTNDNNDDRISLDDITTTTTMTIGLAVAATEKDENIPSSPSKTSTTQQVSSTSLSISPKKVSVITERALPDDQSFVYQVQVTPLYDYELLMSVETGPDSHLQQYYKTINALRKDRQAEKELTKHLFTLYSTSMNRWTKRMDERLISFSNWAIAKWKSSTSSNFSDLDSSAFSWKELVQYNNIINRDQLEESEALKHDGMMSLLKDIARLVPTERKHASSSSSSKQLHSFHPPELLRSVSASSTASTVHSLNDNGPLIPKVTSSLDATIAALSFPRLPSSVFILDSNNDQEPDSNISSNNNDKQYLGSEDNEQQQQQQLSEEQQKEDKYIQTREALNYIGQRYEILRMFNILVLRYLGLYNWFTRSYSGSTISFLSECSSLFLDMAKRPLWEYALRQSTSHGHSRFELVLDFGRALSKRGFADTFGKHTVFAQAFRVMHFMPTAQLRVHGKLYNATLRGMGSHDDGGPYRQTFSQYCIELQSTPGVGLLLPCANRVNNVHNNRDRWLPNPGAVSPVQISMFEFLGKLMGIAIRNKEYLDLCLPSLIWKKLVNQVPTLEDLRKIDLLSIKTLETILLLFREVNNDELQKHINEIGGKEKSSQTSPFLKNLSRTASFSLSFVGTDARKGLQGRNKSSASKSLMPSISASSSSSSSSSASGALGHEDMLAQEEDRETALAILDTIYFTVVSLDGREIELCPGGKNKKVTYANCEEYARKLLHYKLHEFDIQVDAILRGLATIIPQKILTLFSWDELELMVCGQPKVDLKLLREKTIYSGCSESDDHIRYFWRVLESFTEEQRSAYIRFAWGRSKLPIGKEGWDHSHKIASLSPSNGLSADDCLPFAHTCYFTCDIPAYSSEEILKKKLLFAIENCAEIDADQTNTGQRAAAMGFQIDVDEDDDEDEGSNANDRSMTASSAASRASPSRSTTPARTQKVIAVPFTSSSLKSAFLNSHQTTVDEILYEEDEESNEDDDDDDDDDDMDVDGENADYDYTKEDEEAVGLVDTILISSSNLFHNDQMQSSIQPSFGFASVSALASGGEVGNHGYDASSRMYPTRWHEDRAVTLESFSTRLESQQQLQQQQEEEEEENEDELDDGVNEDTIGE